MAGMEDSILRRGGHRLGSGYQGAFRKTGVVARLEVVLRGHQCLGHLERSASFTAASRLQQQPLSRTHAVETWGSRPPRAFQPAPSRVGVATRSPPMGGSRRSRKVWPARAQATAGEAPAIPAIASFRLSESWWLSPLGSSSVPLIVTNSGRVADGAPQPTQAPLPAPLQ